MKKLYIFSTAVLGLLFFLPDTGTAIPAFARKFGFNCNMCHTAFTKLNDFGQRIRDNGYQLPGQEGKETTIFDTPPPLALRTSTGLVASHSCSNKGTATGFRLNGLDMLAAGAMHKNVSVLLIYTPRIDEPAADFSGSHESSNPSQPGALESANIVFSNLIPDALNLRVGRFEPGYHAFSSKRSYYLMQGYEVYTFTTPNNNFVFDDNQIGVEATGHFKNGFKYAAGIVNGTGASPDNNKYRDVYANVYQTFGRGEGQSAGQRIGAFGYLGWQPLTTSLSYVSPTGEAEGHPNKSFYRVGGDVSLNWRTFNLMGLVLYGQDDSTLNGLSSSDKYFFAGGFAELDWAGLANNRLVLSAVYNWVNAPSYDNEQDISAFSCLTRYYLGDWTAINVALHGEYTYRQVGKDNPDKEHNFAALIDFAF